MAEDLRIPTIFVRSTYSGGSGNCVEVSRLPDGAVLVRDSKDPSRAMLKFTSKEWTAFIKGVKSGEFDT